MLTATRAAFRLARTALHLLWGVATAATVFPWLPSTAQLALKARWSRQLLDVLGVRLRTTGTPPAGGLLVANHLSWLDVFAINAVAPTTFLSKDDVRRWPVIGWLAARVGTLFLERGSRLAAQRAREHLVGELRQGVRVCVFPEGTTSIGDHVLPFHGALFQSAIDAGVPVAPALLRYTGPDGRRTDAAAYVDGIDLWPCVRNIVGASGLTANVDFLPVIATASADRRHLAHHSHQVIAHALTRATPTPTVPLGAHMAVETLSGPRGEPQSGNRPTGSPNPAPGDSSPA